MLFTASKCVPYNYAYIYTINNNKGGFLGGPVVKNLPCDAQ